MTYEKILRTDEKTLLALMKTSKIGAKSWRKDSESKSTTDEKNLKPKLLANENISES